MHAYADVPHSWPLIITHTHTHTHTHTLLSSCVYVCGKSAYACIYAPKRFTSAYHDSHKKTLGSHNVIFVYAWFTFYMWLLYVCDCCIYAWFGSHHAIVVYMHDSHSKSDCCMYAIVVYMHENSHSKSDCCLTWEEIYYWSKMKNDYWSKMKEKKLLKMQPLPKVLRVQAIYKIKATT